MLEFIKSRRSIRKYTPEEVSEEDLTALLEAAMAAPSANNSQPWEFIVVRDEETRGKLAQTHPGSHLCKDAPLVIVVCGNPDLSPFWVQSTSTATENLLLAATALGLGGVWVGIHPQKEEDEAHVRQVLHIPPHLRVLCLLPIGHPAESKPPRTQYDPQKVHRETY